MRHIYKSLGAGGNAYMNRLMTIHITKGFALLGEVAEEIYADVDTKKDANGNWATIYKIDQTILYTVTDAKESAYSIRVAFPQPDAPDNTSGLPGVHESTCTMSDFSITAEAVKKGSGQTLIGNNGMSCAFGNSALAINENGVVMRFNRFAMRVTEKGLQVTRNGGGTNDDGWEDI